MVEKYINRIANEMGIVGRDFGYSVNPDTKEVSYVSVFREEDKDNGIFIESDKIESLGTLRLISIMPAVLSALQKGQTLIMDELDSSLHPMVVMSIISLFHNSDVNKKGAQLIFNTHNPIYLSNRLLRRDEIKFVERNKETKSSELYALSDFKANGKESVRNTTDYMKNYFINRYGAIEYIDFTDIVLDLLNEGGDDR